MTYLYTVENPGQLPNYAYLIEYYNLLLVYNLDTTDI